MTTHCDYDSHYWEKHRKLQPNWPATHNTWCNDCGIGVQEWIKTRKEEMLEQLDDLDGALKWDKLVQSLAQGDWEK